MQNEISKNESKKAKMRNIFKNPPSKYSSCNNSFISNSFFPRENIFNRIKNQTIFFTPQTSSIDNEAEINNSTEFEEHHNKKFCWRNTIFDPITNLLFLGKKRKFENLSMNNEVNVLAISENKKSFKGLEISNDIDLIIDDKIKTNNSKINVKKEKITEKKEKLKEKTEKLKRDKKVKNEVFVPKKEKTQTKNNNITDVKKKKEKDAKINETMIKQTKSKSEVKKKSTPKHKNVVQAIINNLKNAEYQIRTRSQSKKKFK